MSHLQFTECCIDDCYYILKPVQTYIMKQTEILMIEIPNILLKQVCGWYDFAILLENVTSRACLFRSELSDNVHSDLFFKLEFNAQA